MSGLIGAAIGIEQSISQGGLNLATGVIGSFGSLTFQVVGSPTEIETANHYHYAKVDVIGAPPVLQWIYDDLATVKLTTLLHFFWCSPAQVAQSFTDLAITHNAYPLTLGSVVYGNFVIAQCEVKDTWRADDGTLLIATVKLELTQWGGQVSGASGGPTVGTTNAPAGSAINYSPPPAPLGPLGNFLTVGLFAATRLGTTPLGI